MSARGLQTELCDCPDVVVLTDSEGMYAYMQHAKTDIRAYV
jgi:hypothetical protein